MPLAAIPIGAWLAVGSAAATAGTTIYATKKQADAAKQAAKAQETAADKALEFAKAQDDLDRESYEREYERDTFLTNEKIRQQQEDRARREGLLAPYRDFGLGGASKLAHLLGTSGGPSAAPPLAPAAPPPEYAPPRSMAPPAGSMHLQPVPVPAGVQTVADLARRPTGRSARAVSR